MVNLWHTTLLEKVNSKLYSNVLTCDHIATDEVSKTFDDITYFGFVLHKENPSLKTKEKYFLPTEQAQHLPIIVTDKTKFSYKNEVHWFIKAARSVKIPSEKRMTFRQLVDTVADYQHSEPDQWTLFKIIMLAGYCERLNIRIVSEASFGKDGMTDILQLICGGVANLYKATIAKLKYSLRNDFIVINELGALTGIEVADMQMYLLQAGAYKPRYENNTRSTAGTKEMMDLTNKSHIIFHNIPYYYENKKQKYFEQMFTVAVMDRFPPLLMEGYVKEDFTDTPISEDLTEERVTLIKDVISTINYYKENKAEESRWSFDEEIFGFRGKEKQRSLRSFKTIVKYIDSYSETQQEFEKWIALLKQTHQNYKEMVE